MIKHNEPPVSTVLADDDAMAPLVTGSFVPRVRDTPAVPVDSTVTDFMTWLGSFRKAVWIFAHVVAAVALVAIACVVQVFP